MTYDLKIRGIVYSDYLDPDLGTEMALVMAPYYGWANKHGIGLSHQFRDVPEEVVRDLLEDMGNVAYLRRANGEYNIAAAMRKAMDRIEALLA